MLAKRPETKGSMKRARRQDRGPLTEYLVFRLAGESYAAPVALVREILKPPPLTPVPRAPWHVLGIISVRGKLVTVVDLRRRMRLAETDSAKRARILLVEAADGETIGLYVDEVLQVVRLAEGEIEVAASALGGDVAGAIAGIARPAIESLSAKGAAADIALVVLLDLRAILGT